MDQCKCPLSFPLSSHNGCSLLHSRTDQICLQVIDLFSQHRPCPEVLPVMAPSCCLFISAWCPLGTLIPSQKCSSLHFPKHVVFSPEKVPFNATLKVSRSARICSVLFLLCGIFSSPTCSSKADCSDSAPASSQTSTLMVWKSRSTMPTPASALSRSTAKKTASSYASRRRLRTSTSSTMASFSAVVR